MSQQFIEETVSEIIRSHSRPSDDMPDPRLMAILFNREGPSFQGVQDYIQDKYTGAGYLGDVTPQQIINATTSWVKKSLDLKAYEISIQLYCGSSTSQENALATQSKKWASGMMMTALITLPASTAKNVPLIFTTLAVIHGLQCLSHIGKRNKYMNLGEQTFAWLSRLEP